MADTTDKGEGSGIATPDAMAQVEALKTRVMQSGAEVEEANRRSASATEAARVAIETANAAVEAVGATNRSSELDTANRDMEDLKARHREAFTAADADALADVQAKMARLGGRIERLETEKAAKPARAADAGRVAPRDPGTADQFEQFLSTRTPQTAAWLRANRQHWQDAVANGKIIVADRMWDRTGKPKDSPEYFSYIEKEAGLAGETAKPADDEARASRGADGRDKGAGTGTEGTASDLTPAGGNAALPSGRRGPPQAGRGRGTPIAAPPTRDGAPNLSGRGDSGAKRITPEMQQWAKMMYPATKDNPDGGIDPEQYFDEYTRLKEEGEINDRFGR